MQNATLDRKAAAKAPVEDLADPVISNPVQLTDKGAETVGLEKGTSGTPGGNIAVDQGLESQSNFVPVPVSDDEMRRQHQAATKVQAVFRGYLVILALHLILILSLIVVLCSRQIFRHFIPFIKYSCNPLMN